MQWVERKAGPPVVAVDTMSELSEHLHFDHAIVGHFNENTGDARDAFEKGEAGARRAQSAGGRGAAARRGAAGAEQQLLPTGSNSRPAASTRGS